MSNIINVATFEPEDSLGKKLHPNTVFKFNSILGRLNSLANGMFFLNRVNFKIKWLDEDLDNEKYKVIRKSIKKTVPNYWEITKLLITDRVLQDLSMLSEVSKFDESPKFVPVLRLKRGILTNVIKNDKLHIYGLILTRIVRYLLDSIKELKLESIEDMDNDTYQQLVKTVKEKVWADILDHSEGRILANVNDDKDNEELYRIFMSIRYPKINSNKKVEIKAEE